ncbi:(2,3-dihydroxybenzoyl)adenylate synthase [Amycolatopsis sp. NPDC059021]|uniref:(2,3-dihydroxybenzoyl)adenylate synthase n=1 Tax=Amycolatopsis sp. NPDC059021 TaxID=3346704 RepID=UPI003670E48B
MPSHAERTRRYRRSGLWRGETITAALRSPAPGRAARTALISEDIRLSHADLGERADRLAAGLATLGIAAGDRVVVHLPNIPEFFVLTFALFRIGAIPVLALPAHRVQEIEHLCEASGAVAYVTVDTHFGSDHREIARNIAKKSRTVRHVILVGDAAEFTPFAECATEPREFADPDPSGTALLLLSGGTTGRPKLIPRTHDDYGYNFRASAEVCALTESDTYLAVLPVAHNFALACPGVLGTLYAGGTAVLSTSAAPEDAFRLIAAERVTVTALVPAVALQWAEAAEWARPDLSSLRLTQVGGAKLDPTAARRLPAALGGRLQQVFGMAEGLLNFTRLDDPDELVHTTQGRPLSPEDEIRIVDEHDRDVPAGAVGELLTRGPYTITGYAGAPEHNRRVFTADGFFRTGDLVRGHPTGHLTVHGRTKDVVNRAGDKVSAVEVEENLLTCPDVRAAAVVPAPDAVLGEAICAYVVPGPAEPSLAGVIAFLRDRGLAPYKFPDRLCLVPGLPLTSAGKVDKKALTRRAAQHPDTEQEAVDPS